MLPEDEIIDIKCRPQDRIVAGNNAINCLLLITILGLMLPEDEIIDIKCRPQDRSVAGNNAINFQENL